MSTIKRSNNNLHIGEGKVSNPKFIGRVRNIADGSFSYKIQDDFLTKASANDPVSDVPDETVVDEMTGEVYGLFHNTDMMIKYRTDGSGIFETVRIVNSGNLNVIAITHHGTNTANAKTFLWGVDYLSWGCKIWYRDVNTIAWGDGYQDWLTLDLNMANVPLMARGPSDMTDPAKYFTENNAAWNHLPGGVEDQLYACVHSHDTSDYYGIPRYNYVEGAPPTQGLSEAKFGLATRRTINSQISNWYDLDTDTHKKHFLETFMSEEVNNALVDDYGNPRGYHITQIVTDYTRRNNQRPFYFQIKPINDNNYTYRWNECVVFHANLDITGSTIQPVTYSDDAIYPVFAPIFYLGTGRTDFDLEKPVQQKFFMSVAPDFGNKHKGGKGGTYMGEGTITNRAQHNCWRSNQLYSEPEIMYDDSNIAPNNPNFTGSSNNLSFSLIDVPTAYHSYHCDWMVFTPWGPIMRAWEWLMIEKDRTGDFIIEGIETEPYSLYDTTYKVPYPIVHRFSFAQNNGINRDAVSTILGDRPALGHRYPNMGFSIISKDFNNQSAETVQSYQNTSGEGAIPYFNDISIRPEAWFINKPSSRRGFRELDGSGHLNNGLDPNEDHEYIDFWGEDWYHQLWGDVNSFSILNSGTHNEYISNDNGEHSSYKDYIQSAIETFQDRFTKYLYCDAPLLGVKYPKKAIQIKHNLITDSSTYADANISFYLPEGSRIAVYKEAAVKWGWGKSPDGSANSIEHVINETFTDAFIINEGTIITLPDCWEGNQLSGPFAKRKITDYTMSIFNPATEGGGDPYTYERVHSLPIATTIGSEEEGTKFHHVMEGSIHDPDYGVPSFSKIENDASVNTESSLTVQYDDTVSPHGVTDIGWTRGVRTSFSSMIPSDKFFWNETLNISNGYGSSDNFAAQPTVFRSQSEWGALFRAESHLQPNANDGRQRYFWSISNATAIMDKIALFGGNWHHGSNGDMTNLLTHGAWVGEIYTQDSNFGLNWLINSKGTTSTEDTSFLTTFRKQEVNNTVAIGGFEPQPAEPIIYEDQYVVHSSTNATAATAEVLEPSIEVTHTVTSGSDANFEQPFSVEYRVSLLYDNFQESPLSDLMLLINESTDREGYEIKVQFDPKVLDSRVTHINVYRKYKKTDGSGDVLNKFVWSEKLSPIAKLNQEISANDVVTYWFDFTDYNDPAASYDAVVGISETLRNYSLRYGISAASDSYLFVTDASVIYDPDYDYSNYIFRSMPGGKFSQFNWAVDYARLEHKPVALETFNGRLFAFTENKLFVLNQATLEVEATYDGVGCIGQHTIQSTAYGICFADYNNIYLIKDIVPEVISATINKKTMPILGANQWSHLYKGWQDVSKRNIHVSFDNVKKCYLIFFSLTSSEGQNYCWSYNLRFNRWDLLTSPVRVHSTYISKAGLVVLSGYQFGFSESACTYNNFFFFLNGTSRKIWHWHSKLLNFGGATQDKRLSGIKVNSLGSLDTNGTFSIFKNRAVVDDSVITNTSDDGIWISHLKLSSNKKFKDVQILLEDMNTIVDTIGIVYTPKMPK